MRSDFVRNETAHLIRIDDNSIIVSLVVTVLMICATVLAASVYSMKMPVLPMYVPRVPVTLSSPGHRTEAPAPIAVGKIPTPAPAAGEGPVAAGNPGADSRTPEPVPAQPEPLPGSEKPQTAPTAKPAAATGGRRFGKKIRLETMRAGRHDGYVSIVFQLSGRIDFDTPQIGEKEIRFMLWNTSSQLRPYRAYPSSGSWVRLKTEPAGLDVHIGLPHHFQKFKAFLMEEPDRLVVNLYDSNKTAFREASGKERLRTPPAAADHRGRAAAVQPQLYPRSPGAGVRLVTVRGGRHDRFASIVFQLDKEVLFDRPRIEKGLIRFELKDTVTGLCPYRRYRTFDSWVGLEKGGSDLGVRIGIPPHFIRMSVFSMQSPPRVVVNLYDR